MSASKTCCWSYNFMAAKMAVFLLIDWFARTHYRVVAWKGEEVRNSRAAIRFFPASGQKVRSVAPSDETMDIWQSWQYCHISIIIWWQLTSDPNSGVENIIYLNQTNLLGSLMTSSWERFHPIIFFGSKKHIFISFKFNVSMSHYFSINCTFTAKLIEDNDF